MLAMIRAPEPAPARFGLIPDARGLVFTCRHCGRPYAVARDAALRAWGEQGRIAETATRIRCKQCGKRGMTAALAPAKAGLGSKADDVAALLAAIARIKPRGEVR
jgi:DNA-directed RNA polymerase subunit RPC12/RpoP